LQPRANTSVPFFFPSCFFFLLFHSLSMARSHPGWLCAEVEYITENANTGKTCRGPFFFFLSYLLTPSSFLSAGYEVDNQPDYGDGQRCHGAAGNHALFFFFPFLTLFPFLSLPTASKHWGDKAGRGSQRGRHILFFPFLLLPSSPLSAPVYK